MDSKIKVGIVGGGSIGLTYAALLAPVSVVILKTRTEEQAEKINNDGVTITYRETDQTKEGESDNVKVTASSNMSSLADSDVVVISVKSYDTESVAKELNNVIKPSCEVVTVQNGLQAYEVLKSNISTPGRIFEGVTYLGATKTDSNAVKQGKVFTTILDDKAIKAVRAFRQTRFGVEPSSDITHEVWTKMTVNTGQNALSAVTNMHLGQLYDNRACLDIARNLVDEFENVAAAEGITFDYDLFEKLKNNWQGSTFYPSMWQDIHNNRKTEIDAINGEIVRRGKTHGIPTPYNEMITSLIKVLESKELTSGQG